MNNIRVRIAPSPTGIPHIGNTRTALFNYLFAKHYNGVFILRIEDTDQTRRVAGSEEAIEEILYWLGLVPDEKYIQSQRLSLYKEKTEELLNKGLAKREDNAVRFIVPKEKVIEWVDGVGEKKISFHTKDIEDFIVLKSDGFPTYHLASVVDDHGMKISHVIRGEEWISSTPKHILLYDAFGWGRPIFVHLPVILGPDKTKLSKRHGAKSALDYRDEGYLPQALLNYMALLGWNPGGDNEIMNMDEMVDLFDLKDINTANPVFDAKKLEWMNGVYIRQLKADELKSKVKSQKSKLEKIDDELISKFIPLAQTRMTTLNDFYTLAQPFIEEIQIFLPEEEKEIARSLIDQFTAIEQWNNETILSAIKKVLVDQNVRMPSIYKIITGKESGLPLPQSLAIWGRENTLKRLKKAI